MSNMINIDCRSREQKRAERRQRFNDFCDDVRRNKEAILVMTPVVVGGLAMITKVASKALNAYSVNKEVDFKQRTIYDRSLGRYVELRRPLTSNEALIIEERRSHGEKLTTILMDLGLLK